MLRKCFYEEPLYDDCNLPVNVGSSGEGAAYGEIFSLYCCYSLPLPTCPIFCFVHCLNVVHEAIFYLVQIARFFSVRRETSFEATDRYAYKPTGTTYVCGFGF